MPDWITHPWTEIFTAAFITAAAAAYVKVAKTRHAHKRQLTADGMGAMGRVNEDLWERVTKAEDELNKLRSTYMACMLKCERVRGQVRYLKDELDRVKHASGMEVTPWPKGQDEDDDG